MLRTFLLPVAHFNLKEIQDGNLQYSLAEANRLAAAVKDRNMEEIKRCISGGIPVDARTESLCHTPLHIAVQMGYKEGVDYLLSQKASLDKFNSYGHNAFILAIIEENCAMVELLLKAGAEANGVDGQNFSAIRYAVERKNWDIIELLQKNGANILNHPIDNEPLLISISGVHENFCDMIRFLINRGMDVDASIKNQSTALEEAILWSNKAHIRLLLNNGADVNRENKNGHSMAFNAVLRDRDAFKMILNTGRIDLDKKDSNGDNLKESLLHIDTLLSGSSMRYDVRVCLQLLKEYKEKRDKIKKSHKKRFREVFLKTNKFFLKERARTLPKRKKHPKGKGLAPPKTRK